MIEKHAQAQTAALADLQSELKSLKTLLVSRHNLPNGSNSVSDAANALLKPKSRGIPAWQLATPTGSGAQTPNMSGSVSSLSEKDDVKDESAAE